MYAIGVIALLFLVVLIILILFYPLRSEIVVILVSSFLTVIKISYFDIAANNDRNLDVGLMITNTTWVDILLTQSKGRLSLCISKR